MTEGRPSPGAVAGWSQQRSLSGKSSGMRTVFKMRLTAVCMMDHGQRSSVYASRTLSCAWYRVFLPLIFSPSWTHDALVFHFSNFLFSVRNFCSAHPELRVSALHPHRPSSLGKVHLFIRFQLNIHQSNSNFIVLKVSTECGKEIPLCLSWGKAVRTRNWKGMARWQNRDHSGSVSLNKREVQGRPGTWRRHCYLRELGKITAYPLNRSGGSSLLLLSPPVMTTSLKRLEMWPRTLLPFLNNWLRIFHSWTYQNLFVFSVCDTA